MGLADAHVGTAPYSVYTNDGLGAKGSLSVECTRRSIQADPIFCAPCTG